MLSVILNIGSSGLSEPSLLANAMSTAFSREDAIIFRAPCHGSEYRKSWLVRAFPAANAISTTLSNDVSLIFQVALP